jgi:hypothetical protein
VEVKGRTQRRIEKETANKKKKQKLESTYRSFRKVR